MLGNLWRGISGTKTLACLFQCYTVVYRQAQRRTCTAPCPSANGTQCLPDADAVITANCSNDICGKYVHLNSPAHLPSHHIRKFIHNLAVKGLWSAWGLWSPCSATCSPSVRWRARGCHSPCLSDPDDETLSCGPESDAFDFEDCARPPCCKCP